jgi:hypothetical protein
MSSSETQMTLWNTGSNWSYWDCLSKLCSIGLTELRLYNFIPASYCIRASPGLKHNVGVGGANLPNYHQSQRWPQLRVDLCQCSNSCGFDSSISEGDRKERWEEQGSWGAHYCFQAVVLLYTPLDFDLFSQIKHVFHYLFSLLLCVLVTHCSFSSGLENVNSLIHWNFWLLWIIFMIVIIFWR